MRIPAGDRFQCPLPSSAKRHVLHRTLHRTARSTTHSVATLPSPSCALCVTSSSSRVGSRGKSSLKRGKGAKVPIFLGVGEKQHASNIQQSGRTTGAHITTFGAVDSYGVQLWGRRARRSASTHPSHSFSYAHSRDDNNHSVVVELENTKRIVRIDQASAVIDMFQRDGSTAATTATPSSEHPLLPPIQYNAR